MRQADRNRPLDDVIERVARPEGVTVEDDPGTRPAFDPSGGSLRSQRSRRAQTHQDASHGRLKMIVMPFATDRIEGSPSDSGVRRRSMVELPVGNVISPSASPMAGTTSRAAAASGPPSPSKLAGAAAPVARSTASTRVTSPPPPPPMAR